MDTVVARIGKSHGLHGEVTVQVHTDNPQERLAVGTSYDVAGLAAVTQLTIAGTRVHNGTWLVAFEGHTDRSAAEALRGGRLMGVQAMDDSDGWYESELLGLPVYDPSGAMIGKVTGLDVGAAQDRLAIRLEDGRSGLVPLVAALVPEVDVPGRRVVIDAPNGLFDLGPAL